MSRRPLWDNAGRMDPSRKRAIRLSVALTAALLLAGALIYVSFSAGRDELTASQLLEAGAPRRPVHPRRDRPRRLDPPARARALLQHPRSEAARRRPGQLQRDRSGPVRGRAGRAGRRHRRPRPLRRPAELADHEVPLEVPGRIGRPTDGGSTTDGAARSRAPAPRSRRQRLRDRALRSTECAGAARDWVDSGRRAVYALAGLMLLAFALLEIAFLRNDFSFGVVAQTSSTTIPIFYKLAAPVVLAAGVAAAVGDAAVVLVEPGAVPDPPPAAARSRPGRPPFCWASRRSSGRSRRLPRTRSRRSVPRRAGPGSRAGSAADAPEHDDPPADAVLGVHADGDPVRIRGRSPDHAAARLGVDPRHPPVRARPPGCSWGSGSSSAPAGPIRSSAGAATGGGTPSRTPR